MLGGSPGRRIAVSQFLFLPVITIYNLLKTDVICIYKLPSIPISLSFLGKYSIILFIESFQYFYVIFMFVNYKEEFRS